MVTVMRCAFLPIEDGAKRHSFGFYTQAIGSGQSEVTFCRVSNRLRMNLAWTTCVNWCISLIHVHDRLITAGNRRSFRSALTVTAPSYRFPIRLHGHSALR